MSTQFYACTYGAKVWDALNLKHGWPRCPKTTDSLDRLCRHCRSKMLITDVANWNENDTTAVLECPNRSWWNHHHDKATFKSEDGGASFRLLGIETLSVYPWW